MSLTLECSICFDDYTDPVLYKDTPESPWKNSTVCFNCIQHYLKQQWFAYVKTIKTEDCLKALTRHIEEGPPINMRLPALFPCANETKEIHSFYYQDREISAKLDGSLVGKEREAYWDELKAHLVSLKLAQV